MKNNRIVVKDLGVLSYEDSWEHQKTIFDNADPVGPITISAFEKILTCSFIDRLFVLIIK